MAFKQLFPRTEYRVVRGRILKFKSGVIGVPVEYRGEGWWQVVVVGGSHPSYPVDGYDIAVHAADIDAAERLEVV